MQGDVLKGEPYKQAVAGHHAFVSCIDRQGRDVFKQGHATPCEVSSVSHHGGVEGIVEVNTEDLSLQNVVFKCFADEVAGRQTAVIHVMDTDAQGLALDMSQVVRREEGHPFVSIEVDVGPVLNGERVWIKCQTAVLDGICPLHLDEGGLLEAVILKGRGQRDAAQGQVPKMLDP